MNNITAEINIYNKKRRFSMFQTTDIETINAIIAPEQNKVFYVGGIIELYDSDEKKNKKWKVLQIEVNVYKKEDMLPIEVVKELHQGNLNASNIQLIIDVEEFLE
jgi:hypothetical protein